MNTGEPRRPRPAYLASGARAEPPRCGRSGRRRRRAWRRGRGAGRGARRDRPDRAGHLDARRQPHDAAPAHAAHRPATLGRGDHGRHQHDRRQGGRGLRPVHGRGTAAVPAGYAGADRRTVTRQSADRPGRDRRRRRCASAIDVRLDRIPQGRPDQSSQRRRECRGDVRRRKRRPGIRRDRELAAVLPRHGHDRLPDGPDVFRRRAGQGHADGLPARHPAVGEAHRQVPGHHDSGAELRLHDVRQTPAQAGSARPVRPVHAAVGALGRRASRSGRRRGPVRSRRAVRVASGSDRARLRHGRDDGGGVVHRVRPRIDRRRSRRRSARHAAPGRPCVQGQEPGGWPR